MQSPPAYHTLSVEEFLAATDEFGPAIARIAQAAKLESLFSDAEVRTAILLATTEYEKKFSHDKKSYFCMDFVERLQGIDNTAGIQDIQRAQAQSDTRVLSLLGSSGGSESLAAAMPFDRVIAAEILNITSVTHEPINQSTIRGLMTRVSARLEERLQEFFERYIHEGSSAGKVQSSSAELTLIDAAKYFDPMPVRPEDRRFLVVHDDGTPHHEGLSWLQRHHPEVLEESFTSSLRTIASPFASCPIHVSPNPSEELPVLGEQRLQEISGFVQRHLSPLGTLFPHQRSPFFDACRYLEQGGPPLPGNQRSQGCIDTLARYGFRTTTVGYDEAIALLASATEAKPFRTVLVETQQDRQALLQDLNQLGIPHQSLHVLVTSDYSAQARLLSQPGDALLITPTTRGLIQLPTAIGKTTIFSEILEQSTAKALIGVHSRQLAGQTKKELALFAPHLTVKMFPDDADWMAADVTIACYASLARESRQQQLASADFKVIVLDEAHKALGSKTSAALSQADDSISEMFSFVTARTKMIGTTATPSYDKKNNLGERQIGKNGSVDTLLPHRIVSMNLREAQDNGYVAQSSFREEIIPEEAVTAAREQLTTSPKTVSTVPPERRADTNAQLAWLKKHFDQQGSNIVPTVIFSSFITEAVEIAEKLSDEYKIPAAAYTGNDKTGQSLTYFKEGSVSVLVVTDIGNQGMDVPKARTGIFLNPSESFVDREQQCGRILRLDPTSLEKHAEFIDLQIAGRQKPSHVTLSDIFEGQRQPHRTDISSPTVTRALGRSTTTTVTTQNREMLEWHGIDDDWQRLTAAWGTDGLTSEGWGSIQELAQELNLAPGILTEYCSALEAQGSWLMVHRPGSREGYLSPPLGEQVRLSIAVGDMPNSQWVTTSQAAALLRLEPSLLLSLLDASNPPFSQERHVATIGEGEDRVTILSSLALAHLKRIQREEAGYDPRTELPKGEGLNDGVGMPDSDKPESSTPHQEPMLAVPPQIPGPERFSRYFSPNHTSRVEIQPLAVTLQPVPEEEVRPAAYHFAKGIAFERVALLHQLVEGNVTVPQPLLTCNGIVGFPDFYHPESGGFSEVKWGNDYLGIPQSLAKGKFLISSPRSTYLPRVTDDYTLIHYTNGEQLNQFSEHGIQVQELNAEMLRSSVRPDLSENDIIAQEVVTMLLEEMHQATLDSDTAAAVERLEHIGDVVDTILLRRLGISAADQYQSCTAQHFTRATNNGDAAAELDLVYAALLYDKSVVTPLPLTGYCYLATEDRFVAKTSVLDLEVWQAIESMNLDGVRSGVARLSQSRFPQEDVVVALLHTLNQAIDRGSVFTDDLHTDIWMAAADAVMTPLLSGSQLNDQNGDAAIPSWWHATRYIVSSTAVESPLRNVAVDLCHALESQITVATGGSRSYAEDREASVPLRSLVRNAADYSSYAHVTSSIRGYDLPMYLLEQQQAISETMGDLAVPIGAFQEASHRLQVANRLWNGGFSNRQGLGPAELYGYQRALLDRYEGAVLELSQLPIAAEKKRESLREALGHCAGDTHSFLIKTGAHLGTRVSPSTQNIGPMITAMEKGYSLGPLKEQIDFLQRNGKQQHAHDMVRGALTYLAACSATHASLLLARRD